MIRKMKINGAAVLSGKTLRKTDSSQEKSVARGKATAARIGVPPGCDMPPLTPRADIHGGGLSWVRPPGWKILVSA